MSIPLTPSLSNSVNGFNKWIFTIYSVLQFRLNLGDENGYYHRHSTKERHEDGVQCCTMDYL